MGSRQSALHANALAGGILDTVHGLFILRKNAECFSKAGIQGIFATITKSGLHTM